MDLQKMQRVVVDALEDVKAQGIKVFNTVGLSDMFDRVVVASGTSNRQTRALADNVARKVKDAGGNVVSVEGTESGEWVLVDLGDVVVHIMQPAVREYYGLEEMWGSRPVRVKLGGESPAPRVRQKVTDDAMKPRKSAAPSGARVTTPRTSSRAATKPATKAATKAATQATTKAATKSATAKARTRSPTKSAARKTAAGSSGRARKSAPARPRGK